MKTFYFTTSMPAWGLAYYAVTLIPPESLKTFYEIIIEANNHYKSSELECLIRLISEAIIQNKFIIHFGI